MSNPDELLAIRHVTDLLDRDGFTTTITVAAGVSIATAIERRTADGRTILGGA